MSRKTRAPLAQAAQVVRIGIAVLGEADLVESREARKVGNCQIGVSVHVVTDWASAALDWRLFLPKSWDDSVVDHPDVVAEIQRRRARSRIPEQVRHQEKWRQALDMLDEITGDQDGGGWGLARRPVVADAGYGDTTEFRLGLQARGLRYVLAVKGSTSAYPADAVPVTRPYSGRSRPPAPGYREDPSNFTALALAAGRSALRRVVWRHGSRKNARNPTAATTSRFMALRVRPANRDIPRHPDGAVPECWLIAEWPAGKPEPTDYWLSTMPADTPLRELVRLAKIRWRIEHDYRELKGGLGLDGKFSRWKHPSGRVR